MKHLLTAFLLAFSAVSVLADSPEAILKDYRKQAAQAVARLNQSLEKTTTPMITKLVVSGDTAGAELLSAQLKAKTAGEPVAAPQAKAASLFTLYDAARVKALVPVQQAAVARIEAMLASSEGSKLDVVTELGRVRAEIGAPKVVPTPDFPLVWTYHRTTTSPIMAELKLEPKGTWKLTDPKTKQIDSGKWVQTGKNTFDLGWNGAVWKMTLEQTSGTIYRPDMGMRYLFLPANP